MSQAIPRLEMNELAPALISRLQPRVRRLGYLGEFFKCVGHQPQALAAFIDLTDALKEALPDRITEVVALTVASLCQNPYERHQHERLSEKLGFGREWIASVMALQPDAGSLSPAEMVVQRLTLASLRDHGHGVSAEVAEVVASIGPDRAIAVLMLIGRYATHALIVNALELAPPVASIFSQPPVTTGASASVVAKTRS
jgi:alkylhydroperoxidase family enzyme